MKKKRRPPVVIFAGGKGTRLAEETTARPKPMIEIGGRPLLWHIMSHYARHGLGDFVVACGYRGEVIKEYFSGLPLRESDCVVDLSRGRLRLENRRAPDWRVALVDTGLDTMTGGRLLRLKPRLKGTFLATYGDGVSNVDLGKLLAFHRRHGKIATVTAVRPPARFGGLALAGERVAEFTEKPQTGEGWINGGFFAFEPEVFDYIDGGDEAILEREPLERLARERQLMAYRHEGFWQPMDTLRDRQLLESLWSSGHAPWKTW